MKKTAIHFLQHVSFEGPGCIQDWIRETEHPVAFTRFFKNDPLPAPDSFDWLIIMGGPMNVHDERQYSWLKAEKEFILKAIREEKTVIGICLGAQLIACALGARVYPNKEKEIGWFPVEKTEQGLEHPLFSAMPASFTTFHWHGDTFELPRGATHLARSSACMHQAFLYNHRVLGLQFHFEVTRKSLKEMIRHGTHELVPSSYIQPAEKILSESQYFAPNNEWMKTLLNRLPV